ncbi:Phosphoribosylaminoimidazole-succinocarboxamide synthase [Raoultella ornithinolytica]|nr:Phosphoribosylaminoimidazole-succinocarboxamide synthase [Raoultella ornithinolytica]
MQKQAELYRGKAKTVYSTENPDLLVLEFRNDTSAGDGARIEQFDRKGMVNNKFNHFIMSKTGRSRYPDSDGSVALRYRMSGKKNWRWFRWSA